MDAEPEVIVESFELHAGLLPDSLEARQALSKLAAAASQLIATYEQQLREVQESARFSTAHRDSTRLQLEQEQRELAEELGSSVEQLEQLPIGAERPPQEVERLDDDELSQGPEPAEWLAIGDEYAAPLAPEAPAQLQPLRESLAPIALPPSPAYQAPPPPVETPPPPQALPPSPAYQAPAPPAEAPQSQQAFLQAPPAPQSADTAADTALRLQAPQIQQAFMQAQTFLQAQAAPQFADTAAVEALRLQASAGLAALSGAPAAALGGGAAGCDWKDEDQEALHEAWRVAGALLGDDEEPAAADQEAPPVVAKKKGNKIRPPS